MDSIISPIQSELECIAHLSGCLQMLQWDQECFLPSESIESRAQQKAVLAGLIHQKKCSPLMRSFMSDYFNLDSGQRLSNSLSPDQSRLVQTLYRDWRLATCLPEAFVIEWEKVTARAQHIWQSARKAADFSLFEPHLKHIVELCRQKAHYIGFNDHPYEALLGCYEPGITLSQLDQLFAPLQSAIHEHILHMPPHTPSLSWPSGSFPLHLQEQFNSLILKDTCFNMAQGRLDISTHPFTLQIHPHDVRITTRYNDRDPLEGISSTLHEVGHGLYEQGLNTDWFGTPFCESASLGVHESQSRLWENWIGKSRAYWDHYYPILSNTFPDALGGIDLDTFMGHLKHVQPSLIRVEADEMTYQMHIFIRYELEKKLLDGSIDVSELPQHWNQAYTKYLGITPKNDAEGVLQDVHWACGIIGYFPTYTLGNIYAAQLYETLSKAIPDLSHHISQGQFTPFLAWLRQHIHQHGRRFDPLDLIESVTLQPVSCDALLRYFDDSPFGPLKRSLS